MTAPEPASVSAWGELRGEKKLAGVLRVLVGGQHAGAMQHTADGWAAEVHGLKPAGPTTHATADEALKAILRSSWARRLGARPASKVYWSGKATRLGRHRARLTA